MRVSFLRSVTPRLPIKCCVRRLAPALPSVQGLQLERLYGSVGFGLLVGEMLVLSHAITVLMALVLAEVPSYA